MTGRNAHVALAGVRGLETHHGEENADEERLETWWDEK